MKSATFFATLVLATSGITASAYATSGQEAVNSCKARKGCALAMNKDGTNIDIISEDNTYIHCADLKAQCTIPRKAKTSGIIDKKVIQKRVMTRNISQ